MGVAQEVATTTAGLPAPRPPVSLADFLAQDGAGPLAEWVDGEVVVHALPTAEHQDLMGFLSFLLRGFAELLHLGRVFPAGYPMLLSPAGPAREPDVLFVAAAHLDRISSGALHGPADLAVEVVSDDSVGRDRGAKFDEYQQGGVAEYWVIDPRPGRERADFWRLGGDGRYLASPAGPDGVYNAAVLPGFWIRVGWLRPAGLPSGAAALAEIAATNPELARALAAVFGLPAIGRQG